MTDPTHQEDSQIDRALGEDWPVKNPRLRSFSDPETDHAQPPGDLPMTAENLFLKLAETGGCIVSSGACSTPEIADAQACRRFVIVESLGFVLRPPKKDPTIGTLEWELANLPTTASAEKLKAENATLRDWIRREGDRTDVCTYDVLREICDGCNCQRKRP